MPTNYSEYVILLTSCVTPGYMGQTVCLDPLSRLEDYKKALDFYLRNTVFEIVIADNSGFDFSPYIPDEYIHRVECISFYGNNYNPLLGKGFGEGRIIDFAISHSHLLKKHKYIIKITGRHIVCEINRIIRYHSRLPKNKLYIMGWLVPGNKWMTSDIIIGNLTLFKHISEVSYEVNDSNKIYFENIVFRVIQEISRSKQISFIHSPFRLIQQGISGSIGQPLTPIDTTLKCFIKSVIFRHNLQSLIWEEFK